MQRSLLIALLVLACGLLGAAWWLLRDDTPLPAPSPMAPAAQGQDDGTAAAAADLGGTGANDLGGMRAAVAAGDSELLDDPEIRAGLCGFKGRVVDHRKVPVADTGVRIYRGALDSVLTADFDLFAAAPDYTPDYIAGEVRTAADGTWQLTGVWPRAFYMLFAGIGSDAPTHQIVTRTPSPGEIVDLGDIVLNDAGVLVGTVLGEDGEPLAGALVRAADLPGTLAAFFPVERFDPKGAILVREASSPVRVVEMPAWVQRAFDELPIPTTRSGSDGRFRLVGVVPGSNLLATTANGYLSDVKPSVQVKGGQEKDVGKIRLKRGEELVGKVIDSAGKPVAGAEVLAGSTLTIGPVDLAQRLGSSAADGTFQGTGFSPGKVTVAARRGKGHGWVLAEPQSVLGDVVVTLPAAFALEVTVALADGKPAKEPRFQLLQGKAGQGAAEMHLLGFVPPIELKDRRHEIAEGSWRFENLPPGSYTLLADAPGHAMAVATVDLTTNDVAVTLALTAPRAFAVRVVDMADQPIRNVAIFAEARGGQRTINMPVRVGRTDAKGQLEITKLQGELLRVSAEHPRWGTVHGESKPGEELLLRMQPPGSLQGRLVDGGKPPELGKFNVALVRRGGDGPRGPLEQVPSLLTPALDGTFAVAALQPGKYQLQPIKALDALRSPGGIFALGQEMFMMRDLSSVEVDVQSGQPAMVEIDVGEKPIDGPTARLSGSLTIDGRLSSGNFVTASAGGRDWKARTDERGRFDFGLVAAGEIELEVMANVDASMMVGPVLNLWASKLVLTAAETRDVSIEIQTSSIDGVCYLPDGKPAAGVFVQAQGQPKGKDGNGRGLWLGAPTDSQGVFRFAQVAEGTWTLSARGNGESAGRGTMPAFEVQGGVPVSGLRFEMQRPLLVKGRVDLTSFGDKKPRGWLGIHRLGDNEGIEAQGVWADGCGINRDSGAFSTDDLSPGRYRLEFHVTEDRQDQVYDCDLLVVPPAGLDGVVVRVLGKRAG
ncbi:MAG: carboxypeptidase-like regulatory domain-containing protein [Planctomycetes bacterium]|jgi:uncharacterized GH25 family protein|nr:carboxypeptidase-like regulatory domain-containing protein [Planctomycetota bacterium]